MTTEIQGYLTKRIIAESEQTEGLADPRQGGSGAKWSAGSQRPEQPFYRVVIEHPLHLARRQVRGMVTFFLDPGRFDFYQFFSNPIPVEDSPEACTSGKPSGRLHGEPDHG